MPLVHCTDVAPGDWIATSRVPWMRLVTFGPDGFERYARLRFTPDPQWPGQRANDVDFPDRGTEPDQVRAVLDVLARHTSTPDDCWFALWEGWGDLSGGDAAIAYRGGEQGPTRRRIDPAFPPSVLDGPKLVIPHRAFLLFRGPLSAAGDWGAAPMWPGQPRPHLPPPAFVWPADHAWCVANDIDAHWAGIGASENAIDELVTDGRLDVVPAEPSAEQPSYY
jgi:hypothetical protein